jgi:UDP-N-acetylmuramoylalanine--D-glutamate ligase
VNWHDKNCLVLGAGDTGVSVVKFLQRFGGKDRMGHRLRIADNRERAPGIESLRGLGVDVIRGQFTDDIFRDAELIIASPGVAIQGPACDPAIARAIASGKKCIGDIELFAWQQNQQLTNAGARPKVLGITGANGKSTVTAMASAMCAAAGLRSVAAGNIGLPVLDALLDEDVNGVPDVYVLELSSFQLETTSTLQLDAATMLNLSQDHLDRYSSMADYARAKQRIFANAKHQVINRDDVASMSMKTPNCECASFGLNAPTKPNNAGIRDGWLVRGDTQLMHVADMPVLGLHNVANALAAFLMVDAIGVDLSRAAEGLSQFKGLPHRSEWVDTIGGVRFINDSKATNVGSTVAALSGMTAPTILIAGGLGKSQDFGPLFDAVSQHAKAVVLMGRDAADIAAAIKDTNVECMYASDMAQAVKVAYSRAVSGDVVLLSPASASLDMFNNYQHRGEVFKQSVAALSEVALKTHTEVKHV